MDEQRLYMKDDGLQKEGSLDERMAYMMSHRAITGHIQDVDAEHSEDNNSPSLWKKLG